MKINRIIVNNPKGFRGLPDQFEITFKNVFNRNEIDPVCLAGLNGSGKSNVLELISEIFFYLEAAHHSTAKDYVYKKSPFGFSIEYETKVTGNNYKLDLPDSNIDFSDTIGKSRIVLINKPKGKTKPLEIKVHYEGEENPIPIPSGNNGYEYNVKQLLPSKIIAYSSGHNELVSNPFLRMDFFYFEEYLKELDDTGDSAEIAQNRLFYMDYDSNASVLLSNFLMRDVNGTIEQKELGILKKMTGLDDVESFNIVLNLKVKRDHSGERLLESIENLKGLDSKSILDGIESQLFWDVRLPRQLNRFVEQLEQCCSYSDFIYHEEGSEKWKKVTLYFKQINDDIKYSFQSKFSNGLNLFRQFYLMNLLNIYNYSDEIRDKVKREPTGTSVNISDLIPKFAKKDKVFYIDDLKLKKNIGQKRTLYYKNLSDGEHQFLHIVGSLMLMEEEGTIFLLDEPSTHFNPDWRSKFINTINQIYLLRKERLQDPEQAKQLVTLSTHSPFVLSDSKSKNVLWLKKVNGKPTIEPLEFETYGASVDYIMKRINQLQGESTRLIPERAYLDFLNDLESTDLDVLRQAINKFGESPEKQYLYQRIYELTNPMEDDSTTS